MFSKNSRRRFYIWRIPWSSWISARKGISACGRRIWTWRRRILLPKRPMTVRPVPSATADRIVDEQECGLQTRSTCSTPTNSSWHRLVEIWDSSRSPVRPFSKNSVCSVRASSQRRENTHECFFLSQEWRMFPPVSIIIPVERLVCCSNDWSQSDSSFRMATVNPRWCSGMIVATFIFSISKLRSIPCSTRFGKRQIQRNLTKQRRTQPNGSSGMWVTLTDRSFSTVVVRLGIERTR